MVIGFYPENPALTQEQKSQSQPHVTQEPISTSSVNKLSGVAFSVIPLTRRVDLLHSSVNITQLPIPAYVQFVLKLRSWNPRTIYVGGSEFHENSKKGSTVVANITSGNALIHFRYGRDTQWNTRQGRFAVTYSGISQIIMFYKTMKLIEHFLVAPVTFIMQCSSDCVVIRVSYLYACVWTYCHSDFENVYNFTGSCRNVYFL